MYLRISSTLIALLYLGFPAYATQYSSGGEAFLSGALQGLLILIFIWGWRYFKRRKSKNKDSSIISETSEVKGLKYTELPYCNTPWEEYKSSNPEFAIVIESIQLSDTRVLSVNDIKEIESSLNRMCKLFDCSATRLKGTCIQNIINQFSKEELPDVISHLSSRANYESKIMTISYEHTIPFIMKKWLEQYMYTI